MQSNDYRFSSSEPLNKNLNDKKTTLLKSISLTRFTNHFNAIKDDRFKKTFHDVYNSKCAYCGTTRLLVSSFEYDHYIPRENKLSITNVDYLENLVLSCQKCNRLKSDFAFSEICKVNLLHPDKDEYSKVFFRDKYYVINIKPNYQKDTEIQKFYKQLELGTFHRQIDFLILDLQSFVEKNAKYIQEEVKDKFNTIIVQLLKYKNSKII